MADRVFKRIGMPDRWAYFDAHTSRWFSPCSEDILDICANADLLLNLCGVNPLRAWVREIPARAFVDEDPAFTQFRHLTDPAARQLALGHTVFLSFGENFGRDRCTIPDDGFAWQPARQPVVLDTIPVTAGDEHAKFTTVMQWESYPSREYHGRRYGMKSDSFEAFLNLPERAGRIFELALGGASAPHAMLRSRGWSVRNSLEPTRDPWTYLNYIRQSKAEFSVAKHGYVVSRSGWFSEHSVAYLASGRLVVVQETGFSNWLETGAGVIAFSTPDEAIAGVKEINSRYDFHCRAACKSAEQYFDACLILPPLLESILNAADPSSNSTD